MIKNPQKLQTIEKGDNMISRLTIFSDSNVQFSTRQSQDIQGTAMNRSFKGKK